MDLECSSSTDSSSNLVLDLHLGSTWHGEAIKSISVGERVLH